jgi:hypothetical protein
MRSHHDAGLIDLGDSAHFAAGLALCEAAGCVIADLHGEPSGLDDIERLRISGSTAGWLPVCRGT